MGIIVVWVALCFVAGAIASKKGRSSVGFFFLSLVLSPLIGIIAALIAKPNEEKVEKSKIEEGNSKKCPMDLSFFRCFQLWFIHSLLKLNIHSQTIWVWRSFSPFGYTPTTFISERESISSRIN